MMKILGGCMKGELLLLLLLNVAALGHPQLTPRIYWERKI